MELEALGVCSLCQSRAIEAVDPEYRLSKCRSCGLVFDNPRPTEGEIAVFYSQDTKYDAWLAEERARNLLWERRLKKMQRHVISGPLLDVGAGIGQFLHHARASCGPVYGTEVSNTAITIAKQKYQVALLKGQLEDLVFSERMFRTITLFHILEHVPNPRSLLERCWLLLADDGILIVAVPNDLISLRTGVKRLLRRLGVGRVHHMGRLGLPRIQLDGSSEEIHLSHFTPKVLREALQHLRFSVVEESLDPYYAKIGLPLLLHTVFYGICVVVFKLFRINLYDTIWIVARKQARLTDNQPRQAD